ncbi:hypothetical protein B9Z55_003683 [Caenorhabditis nigoni]|uniref:F-box domain-containing protein n=1 Tax=Caenorhabditis nigoni TaxID=1611254 RepID=A0A2G5VRK3_9PELO|nr:hypothetical protein B9Z55_003683 [Caenorhabditis nigoni]
MPIALLKFPTDLLGDVFKLCNPFELYKLSKCSKRTQKSIKSDRTKSWKIEFSDRNEVIIWADRWEYHFNNSDNPSSYFKTFYFKEHMITMYVQFPNGKSFDMFVYLLETFGIRIVEKLEYREYLNSYLDDFSRVAKVSIERNLEIENLSIRGVLEGKAVANFMPVINQMNITKTFVCLQEFPQNFHYQLTTFPSEIRIYSSFWLDINQLLNCTSSRIELSDSMLSNKDLDVFFEKWKQIGTFPNLRHLVIRSKQIDDKSPGVWYGADRNPVQVIKDDGTVGTLTLEMLKWPTLKFRVYAD